MDENRELTDIEKSIKKNREEIIERINAIDKLKNCIPNVKEQLRNYNKGCRIWFNYNNDEYEVRITKNYRNHIEGEVYSKNYRIFTEPYEGGFKKDNIKEIH